MPTAMLALGSTVDPNPRSSPRSYAASVLRASSSHAIGRPGAAGGCVCPYHSRFTHDTSIIFLA